MKPISTNTKRITINQKPDLNFEHSFFKIARLLIALVVFWGIHNEIWGQSQTFTTTGSNSFTVPGGVTSITVQCWGGGGAGGGSTSNSVRGGGGGAGGSFAQKIISVTPGTTYTNGVVVGSGGTGGTAAGGTGGASYFINASTVYAQGGAGGAAPTGSGSPAGGTGSLASCVGDVTKAGGSGAAGNFNSKYSGAGGGGAGSTGNGGDASGTTAGTGTTLNGGAGGVGRYDSGGNGNSGSTYGGGGSGAYVNNNSNRSGGSGAQGLVVISWTQPVFYSQGTGDLSSTSSWNTSRTGSGYSPTSMTADYQTFVIQNGHTITTSATITLGANSIIEIESGGVLTETYTITLPSTGTLQVDNGGTLNHNVNSKLIFSGSYSFASTSTVDYGYTAAQTLIAATYGNLTISGGSTKTLLGDVTVNGTLTLTSGIISLGIYDLTLASTGSLSGSFSNSNMIRCDGSATTGSFIREGDAVSDFIMTYPIGSTNKYTPMIISTLGTTPTISTIPATLTINTVPEYYATGGAISTDLNRYWTVTTSNLSDISADATFTYVSVDVPTGVTESSYKTSFYSSNVWNYDDLVNTTNHIASTSSSEGLSGVWTARVPAITYYSYQSGAWATAETWTTDASGTLSIGAAVPGAGDNVVILNGRTITATANNYSVSSLEIKDGGILDLGTTTGHTFVNATGQGKLKLSSTSFPSGTFTDFVSADGGTVEYYNVSGTLTQSVYNNLILDNSNSSSYTIILNSDLTINGDFSITRSTGTGSMTFQIGNSTTSRALSIAGDVTVADGGYITTYSGNVINTLSIAGDFTNNGTVKFTNRTAPVTYSYLTTDPTTGGVTVTFTGLSNNTVTCNGTTDFHRLIVDKGSDQTYILTVNSTDEDYFRLFGRNDQAATDFSYNDENLDGVLKNLWIRNGTLKLEGSIYIPSLTEGGGDNYHIPLNGCIWLNSSNVTIDVTMVGQTSNQAFVPFGKVRIDAGTLNCNDGGGIIYRGTAEFEINGGSITATQFRPSSYSSDALTSFTMTGGEITLNGQLMGSSYEINDAKATFCLPFENNTFIMTGGSININWAMSGGAFVVAANNTNVTGGEINLNIANNASYAITSSAQLYNLNVTNSSGYNQSVSVVSCTSGGFNNGSFTTITTPQYDLIVSNNLTIDGTNSATLLMNNANVYVGGNFTIESGGIYTPGTNTTYFNGDGTQTLDATGTITGNFENVELAESSDLTIDGNNITIDGDLTLGSSTILRDNGYIIYVKGDIENNGTHFHQTTGAGSIRMTGSATQVISGDGNGSFNNLVINNSNGVSTEANIAVTGNLRLASGRLNIADNNLLLDTTAIVYDNATSNTQTGFSATKMIVTSGLASDGGVSKNYGSTDAYLFPFGFYNSANSTYYYMPASIQFTSAPTAYGTVTTTPVNGRHPLAQGSANATTCYWKTRSEKFSGIVANSVTHLYYYDYNQTNYFVAGTEASYLPGYYDPTTYDWTYINNAALVNDATNEIKYNTDSKINGDFIAGLTTAFATVPKLYSITNGNWNATSTWSTTGHDGTAGSVTPSANYIVLIGDSIHYHTVTISSNNQTCGSLNIAKGSTLDLQNTNGHNFASIEEEQVKGSGTLRIGRTNYFPTADFGNFLGENGGTVEYYTYSGNISIPTASTSLTLSTYHNLKLTTTGTRTITLPACDLTIYDSLIVNGTGTSILNTTTAGYTVEVKNDLIIESSTFQFKSKAQNLIVDSNIVVASGATFNAASTSGHTLEIKGNLDVDGTFNMNNGGTTNTSFTGTLNDTISGSGTITFYDLVVDKGTDTTYVLTVTANSISTGFTNPFLTLNNGTFRLDNSLLDLTIATTSAFTIPSTACFSVQQGTATIGTTSDDGDVILYGKLELLGGTLNIGTNNVSYNNDIEYEASGNPRIWIENGTLNVYGQIRRNVNVTTGALTYYQKGGTVNLYGQNNDDSRAKLEILNAGSSFTMAGGSIYLLDDNGNTYKDIYLQPESYSVTGGSLLIGNGSTTGLSANIVMSCPIWNLEIAANNELTINTVPQTISNNLIVNSGSVFYANALDVNIGGGLYNYNTTTSTGTSNGGYQAGSATQTTTFNGSADQTITGSGSNMTNFANLLIETGGTLTVNSSNISVNKDVTITQGTFDDGENSIYLYGDLENNDTHYSSSTTGGLYFVGPSAQYISGSGTGIVGNVIINNTSNVTLKDNMTITGQLTFTNGNLYVDDYLLTFDTDATIDESNIGENNMIILNGVMSDLGVKKIFDSGTPSFTYPIGVSGKYTPVTYDFSANSTSGGAITVKPVNYLHKSVTVTPTNYISYYWDVVTSGFGSYTVTHKYVYHDDDIYGTESSYNAEQYVPNSDTWYNLTSLGEGSVEPSTNTIQVSNVDYIDGEYTAGEEYNAQPVLYSLGDGNWNSTTNWSTTPGGSPYGDYPKGNPVVIEKGDSITMNINSSNAYSAEINGVLNFQSTVFHDLGHVSGPGKIVISASAEGSFVFPGGEYEDFLDNDTSTIEFTGSNDGTLPLKPGNNYKPFQNVILSGTGVKYMSSENMKVQGDLTIENNTQLNNSVYNKEITLLGDWTDKNTSDGKGFIAGSGKVTFSGTAVQLIQVAATEEFYNLKINNASGVDLTSGTSGIEVAKYLYLTKGIFTTSSTGLITITNTSTSAVVGGSSTSYVDGPLAKAFTSGTSFTFPTGNDGRYGTIKLSSVSLAGTYTATYYNTAPSNSTSITSPISGISDNEYWVVDRPTGASANITLRYDADSYDGFLSSSTLRSRLRVVEYTNGAWVQRGASVSGNATSGTVATTTVVSQDDYIFTIGHIGVTASIDEINYSICDNDEAVVIPVTLTGTSPWRLVYNTTDGTTTKTFSQTDITSENYEISLTGTDMGGYSGSPYVLSLVSVSDASQTGICSTNKDTITLLQTYKPDITGTFNVGAGETRTFTTALNGTNTYAWSWSGTTGESSNSGTTSYSYTSVITSTTGSYTLVVTETTGTCSASDEQTITVINTPSPEISPVSTSVCQGDVITYSTPSVTGHSYEWTITGGTPSAATGNSIAVTWNGTGTATISVKEYVTSSPTTYGTDDQDLIIYTISDVSTVGDITNACSGSSGQIEINNTSTDISYQLYLFTDNSEINSSVSGVDGTTITLTTNDITSPTNYYVMASNEGCEVRVPASGNISVGITALPTITINAIPDLYRGVTSELTYSATTGDPDIYNIDYTSALNTEGYTDVTGASLAGSIALVVPSTATGSFNATLTVTDNTTGCTSNGVTLSSTLNSENVWTGKTSNSWFTTTNWGYGAIPTSASDIIISSSATYMPTVDAAGAIFNDILIESSATVNSDAVGTLTIDGDWTNNGTVSINAGSIIFNGSTALLGTGTESFNSIEIASLASLTAKSGATMGIAGNFTNNGTFDQNGATLNFNGTNEQIISGSSTITFDAVTLNKASDSLTLNAPVTITGSLGLTSGVIATDATNRLTFASGSSVSGASKDSYVDGPVEKLGDTDFTFPVGDTAWYAGLSILNFANADATTSFICEYTMAPNAHQDGSTFNDPIDHISTAEYWDLTRNYDSGNDASCNVALHYANADSSGIWDLDLLVAHYDGSNWVSMGGTVSGSLGNGSGTVTSTTAFTSFSPITFATTKSTTVNPLPVELLYFTGKAVDEGILLSWATATEINNDYFKIQRSYDAENFTTIGTVDGSGNSSSEITYTFTDESPVYGTQYYRLVQFDYDGISETYSTIAVDWETPLSLSNTSVNIYPNPYSSGDLTLAVSGISDNSEVLIIITNLEGKVICQSEVSLTSNEVNVIPGLVNENLAHGIYLLKVQADNKVWNKKLIVN